MICLLLIYQINYLTDNLHEHNTWGFILFFKFFIVEHDVIGHQQGVAVAPSAPTVPTALLKSVITFVVFLIIFKPELSEFLTMFVLPGFFFFTSFRNFEAKNLKFYLKKVVTKINN